MTRYVRHGFGGLLVVCIALRVAAWLVAPVLPLVLVAFGVLMLFEFVLSGRRS